MDLNLHDFWAGLSDLALVPERFELGEGVTLSQTYAHFMAPFLMAFAPASPGKHHPAPWKPAKGGFHIDITAELFVPATCRLEHVDRLNAVWWIVALLRLKATSAVFVPVISSERFSAIPAIQQEPELWPIEIHTHRLMTERAPNQRVDVAELEWLRLHWQRASALLANENFNIAFQAVDLSIWGYNPALALVAVWGALEQLFSSSNQELSFRVSGLTSLPISKVREESVTRSSNRSRTYMTDARRPHTAMAKQTLLLIRRRLRSPGAHS